MDPTSRLSRPTCRPGRDPWLHPLESRFLFVDVAAMRAKQLRRGALSRLEEESDVAGDRPVPVEAERVAVEEVRRGLVLYDVPEPPSSMASD